MNLVNVTKSLLHAFQTMINRGKGMLRWPSWDWLLVGYLNFYMGYSNKHKNRQTNKQTNKQNNKHTDRQKTDKLAIHEFQWEMFDTWIRVPRSATCPHIAAMWTGVRPRTSRASGLAPCWSNVSTHSSCPFAAYRQTHKHYMNIPSCL